MTDIAASKPINTTGDAADDHSEGMSYLESLPRQLVTVYLPLLIFIVICCFRSTGWR